MEFRQRATPTQFKIMLDFMEKHGDLSRVQPGVQGRLRSESLWLELAELLNSVGDSGIQKAAEKWKRVWSDYKTKTKKKAANIDRVKPFNPLEERVLRIISNGNINSRKGVEEAGFEVSNSSEYVAPCPSQPAQLSPPGVPDARIKLETPCASELCSIEVNEASTHHDAPVNSNSERLEDVESPASVGSSSPRRRRVLARRRRKQTPFERAASEFVRIEDERLRLDEMRIRMQHEKDMEQLRVESQRNEILRRIADTAHNIMELLS